jgi:hypothetical protein
MHGDYHEGTWRGVADPEAQSPLTLRVGSACCALTVEEGQGIGSGYPGMGHGVNPYHDRSVIARPLAGGLGLTLEQGSHDCGRDRGVRRRSGLGRIRYTASAPGRQQSQCA